MMKSNEKSGDAPRIKIINLFGDGGRYAGTVNRAATHDVHFSKYFFDDYMSLSPSGAMCRVDREKLASTVDEIYSGKYTAASCDSNDALLLQFMARKKRLRAMPFIINDVDKFEMAGWVRTFIKKSYREDFFDEFVSARANNWMYILESRGPLYASYGIKPANLFYLPMCTASIEFVFPAFFNPELAGASKNPAVRKMKGKIVAAGTHNRDYETLVRAVEGSSMKVHIITNLAINKPVKSRNVEWHDSLPEADFHQALRDAKMVVIPLKKNSRSAGQLACAAPMKFGKVVIAAKCESISDHIVHNQTGFLYDPGSPTSLRDVLHFAESSYDDMEQIMENARNREAELSKAAAANIKRLLNRLRRTAP